MGRAAYLLWLGARMWREAPRLGALEVVAAATPARRLPAKAFLVTLLNPKSLLFFVAFMPQFLRPDLPLPPQLAVLAATFLALSALNAGAYVLLAGGLARAFGTRARRIAHRLGGASLVGMGLLTATLRRA